MYRAVRDTIFPGKLDPEPERDRRCAHGRVTGSSARNPQTGSGFVLPTFLRERSEPRAVRCRVKLSIRRRNGGNGSTLEPAGKCRCRGCGCGPGWAANCDPRRALLGGIGGALLRRAHLIRVGAEHTTVTSKRPNRCSAGRACPEELTRVHRHFLAARHTTLGTGDRPHGDHGRHDVTVALRTAFSDSFGAPTGVLSSALNKREAPWPLLGSSRRESHLTSTTR